MTRGHRTTRRLGSESHRSPLDGGASPTHLPGAARRIGTDAVGPSSTIRSGSTGAARPTTRTATARARGTSRAPGRSAGAAARTGQDSVHLKPEAERLMQGPGEHRAVAAVLEGVDQALSAEDHFEDAVVDGSGLGVGAHERPGGAPRALGRLEDLLPAAADHLGVRGGARLSGRLRGLRGLRG